VVEDIDAALLVHLERYKASIEHSDSLGNMSGDGYGDLNTVETSFDDVGSFSHGRLAFCA
jgi:hypothetical protein